MNILRQGYAVGRASAVENRRHMNNVVWRGKLRTCGCCGALARRLAAPSAAWRVAGEDTTADSVRAARALPQ